MVGKFTFQVEVPRRSRVCVSGEEEFSPGMHYYSMLLEGADGNLARQDFCISCWEKARQEWAQKAISYWKSTVTSKKEVDVAANQTRDERACALLKQALSSDSLEDKAEAFMLALYLARKRLLYMRQELLQNGSLFQLYEVAATEEMLCVKKIPLSQMQVTVIQQRIAEKLKG